MKKPGTITQEDAVKIMHLLEPRDRDIFWISIETGLRIGDILKLTISDVQHNPLNIYESKSKRRRFIEISDELHQHLRKQYKYSGWLSDKNSQRLCFLTNRGTMKAINRSTYYRRLKRASKALKINFSAHSGRKLYAMNIFKRSKSVPAVQNALNHRFITTTATYLDIDIEKMLREFKPQ